MAKLKSYRKVRVKDGVITSWMRHTEDNKFFKLYFQKKVGDQLLRGLYSYSTKAAMNVAKKRLRALWNKLNADNFPKEAQANLVKYQTEMFTRRQHKAETAKKTAPTQTTIFNDLLSGNSGGESKKKETAGERVRREIAELNALLQ